MFVQGNVSFATTEDQISVTSGDSLCKVSRLLHVAEVELKRALTERVIAARGEVMQKMHTHSEAEYGRDALAKVTFDAYSLSYFFITSFIRKCLTTSTKDNICCNTLYVNISLHVTVKTKVLCFLFMDFLFRYCQ